MEWVEEMTRTHPYFALPYYLLARQNRSQELLFQAATHAPNRRLLRNYMEGQSLHDIPRGESLPLSSNHAEAEPGRWGVAHNLLFALLDFEQLPSPPIRHDQLLSINETGPSGRKNEHLNMLIKELTLRYVTELKKIKTQIQLYLAQARLLAGRKASAHEKHAAREQTEEALTVHTEKEQPPASGIAEMLDQFLKSRPTPRQLLERPDTAPDPEAEKSVAPSEEIVTETLARLHLAQKNYAEARRIYQKLRLLFPEKSAYFDTQIKKLEQ